MKTEETLKCHMPNCKRPHYRGGYCKECFQEFKLGKSVGRVVVPNGTCHICERAIAETEAFCSECRGT